MQDRQPGAPGQYKATVTAAELQKLQAGEQFIITMVRDDQPIVEGTPYSKASVLPDALAAIICPDVLNPTPADALSALLPRNGKAAMTANLPMGGYKVTGLGTPTESGDAVPLGYANQNFAPAGYGYGEAPQYVGISEGSDAGSVFDELTADWTTRTTRQIIVYDANFYNQSILATISRYSAKATLIQGRTYDGYSVVKRKLDNTWGEWEWDNPPMVLGVEYRTTGRWNGKVVYRKLVDFGLSANKKQATVAEGSTMIIQYAGNVGELSTPYANNNDLANVWSAHFCCGTTTATLYCGESMVDKQTYIQLWYTKD